MKNIKKTLKTLKKDVFRGLLLYRSPIYKDQELVEWKMREFSWKNGENGYASDPVPGFSSPKTAKKPLISLKKTYNLIKKYKLKIKIDYYNWLLQLII